MRAATFTYAQKLALEAKLEGCKCAWNSQPAQAFFKVMISNQIGLQKEIKEFQFEQEKSIEDITESLQQNNLYTKMMRSQTIDFSTQINVGEIYLKNMTFVSTGNDLINYYGIQK